MTDTPKRLTIAARITQITEHREFMIFYIIALAGASTAIWLTLGLPVAIAIALGLVVGVLIGFINGLIIAEIGINPFITTLGVMSLARDC